jgi:hypothetical protein
MATETLTLSSNVATATYVNSLSAQTGSTAAGSTFVREVDVTLPSSAAADIFHLIPVFPGEAVVQLFVISADGGADSNNDALIDVGFHSNSSGTTGFLTTDLNYYVDGSDVVRANTGDQAQINQCNAIKYFTESADQISSEPTENGRVGTISAQVTDAALSGGQVLFRAVMTKS